MPDRGVKEDLLVLWRTRRSSGFPIPFRWSMRPRRRVDRARQWVTGHVFYSSVPLWKQVLGVPFRPWRYAKMVREIARTRNYGYSRFDYDSEN